MALRGVTSGGNHHWSTDFGGVSPYALPRHDGRVRDDRDSGLFSAVVAVAAGLELGATLRRIVQAAVDLVDAEYGALGVLGSNGEVADFIHVGIDAAAAERIGPLPTGKGILGLLIEHPVPMRLEDLTSHPASAGFPDGHPAMASFLGVPVRVRGEVFGNLYLTQKRNGAAFTGEDERTVMALAAAAAVAIENARLYERTRQREQWQAATADIANLVLQGAAEEDALTAIAAHVQRLTEADAAVIAIPDAEGRCVIEIVEGSAQTNRDISRWSVQHSQRTSTADDVTPTLDSWLGRVVAEDSSVQRSLRSRQRVDSQSCVVDPSIDAIFGANVALPLLSSQSALGVLVLLWRRDAPAARPDSLAMAELFANQAAVSLALAKTQREQERLAVFEDRDRIARDLHDLVIQRLFATGMSLQGVTRIADSSQEVVTRINRAVDELDETIREIRQTIFALHEPVDGPARGARGRALREITQSAALLGFEPAIRFVGPIDAMVPPSTQEHLIAAMREALTNAAKHAQASHVDVVIGLESGDVVLTVTDDGVGIDHAQTRRNSGLANLSARAHDLGGSCQLTRVSADGGSCLVWRVPIT